VVFDITFSALSLAQFDDASFDTTFRTELVTTIAEAAGVEAWRVSVTSVAAGSVVASLLVQFPLGWEVQRDVFLVSLATNTASVLASSSTLQSYGDVQAVVFAPPPPSPPTPPASPPPPTIEEGGSLDVVFDITFSALSLAQFDDASFDTTFRTELITTIAAAAGVEAWRVSVTSVAAGSVVASLLVQFPLGWEVQRDGFLVSLTTDTASVLASSSTLQSYGTVTAVVFTPPPPVPSLPASSTVAPPLEPSVPPVTTSSPPFVPVAAVMFTATLFNLSLDDPASQQAFTTQYKLTLAAETGTTVDAVDIISITAGSVAGSVVVVARILLLDQASVQEVSTQLMQSPTLMSSALESAFNNTTVQIDPTSVSVQVLVSPPPPPLPPSLPPPSPPSPQDTAGGGGGMDLALVVGVAGGALLMAGVAVGGCCWGGCCRKRKKQAARHAMSHHLVHPLPQPSVGYPASAPPLWPATAPALGKSSSATPDDLTVEDLAVEDHSWVDSWVDTWAGGPIQVPQASDLIE
jgi:hypothetical protein